MVFPDALLNVVYPTPTAAAGVIYQPPLRRSSYDVDADLSTWELEFVLDVDCRPHGRVRSVPARQPNLRSAVRHVTMGDVDAAGILYFPSPYRWLEEMFTGWLRDLGHPLSNLLHSNAACPCVASAASYPSPAKLDEELDLELVPTLIGTSSFGVAMLARRSRDATTVVHAGSWHVWSALGGDRAERSIAPSPLPNWLRDALTAATLCEPPRPGRRASTHPYGGPV